MKPDLSNRTFYPSTQEDGFAPEIIEAVKNMGIDLRIVPARVHRANSGTWVGIMFEAETGKILGAGTKNRGSCHAEGY